VPRSYQQNCPIAKGLDVLGERWTLLILRELIGGPRRYGDLRAQLPGIATNLLADRLRELEAAGLDVIYDDRAKVSPGVKFGDAELVGVPTILAVGRGLVDGVVEIKDRRSGNAENVAVDKAVDYVVNAVRNS